VVDRQKGVREDHEEDKDNDGLKLLEIFVEI
jgi:hypothetical protein